MNVVNPLTGSILQSTPVQRQQAADKDQQMRQVQQLARNSSSKGDHFEHSVESPEELKPAPEHDQQNPQQRRKPPKRRPGPFNDDEDLDDRLDLTA